MTDHVPNRPPDRELETVLDRMRDGVFALDREWRITYANDRGRDILRAAMADTKDRIVGEQFWEAVPGAVDTVFDEKYHEAMESQTPVSFEARYEPLEAWFDVRAFPSESGLSVHFRDVTEQKLLQQERQESLQALQRLYVISSDRDREFEAKLTALLELGTEYLDLPNAFVTRIERDTQFIEASVATHPALQAGESCPLDEAYCRRMIELEELLTVVNAADEDWEDDSEELLTVVNAADEGWEDDPAYERFELGTYIGGRVEVDDTLYGTLCFADTEPRQEPFTDTQQTFVELLTRWLSYELERAQDRETLQRERDRFEEFASVVSHDLRNPLNTASLHLDLLADRADDEHVAAIERSLARMEDLIEDLLSLARTGRIVEDPTDLSLAGVVEGAWQTAGDPAATLETDLGGETVLGDPSRIQQLFENLFRNAVEHGTGASRSRAQDTDEQGTTGVTVRVGLLDGAPGIYIADDGPGIPVGERETVFETGYTTDDDGTGFGLAIVAEVVEAHGWDVSVTESAEGGARFEITGVEFAGG